MNISRRDFIHQAGLGGAALLLSPHLFGCGEELGREGALSQFGEMAYPEFTGVPSLGGGAGDPFWARGNYRPVADEIEAFDLEVIGSLPPELNGHFLRNGSTAREGTPQHWFVGDGMLHGVHLQNGRALSYRNRWVQTAAFQGGEDIMANRANTSL